MGFFSSRKPDEDYAAVAAEKSVVQVIRSRFYGKSTKGKEREEPPSFRVKDASAAQSLSDPPLATVQPQSATVRLTTFMATRKPSIRSLRNFNHEQKPKPKLQQTDMPPPPPPKPSQPSSPVASPTQRKPPTDSVTMTLAQRLNDLAAANSEGLLTDDEYRQLRQNVFERFAGNSVVPTETPVVPITIRGTKSPLKDRTGTGKYLSASNFVVQVPPSPSTRSRPSLSSSLFRRPSTQGHTSAHSKDYSDSSSIFSATSNISNIFRLPRVLSKKSSNSSMRTDVSTKQQQADTMSISSRRTASERSPTESTIVSPFSPRSAGSIRRFATPPSSFHRRGMHAASENTPVKLQSNGNATTLFEEYENLTSTVEIKQEIAALEAEGRRLMDAFSGLELTTLAKRRRHHLNYNDEVTTLSAARRHQQHLSDNSDALSMRSGRSAYSFHPAVIRSKSNNSMTLSIGGPALTNTSSRPSSLRRKNSNGSVASGRGERGHSRSANGLAPPLPIPPPLPSMPVSAPAEMSYSLIGGGDNASRSSINLSRYPMRSVPEDLNVDEVEASSISGRTEGGDAVTNVDAIEEEMDEIRRRREEVSLRYEARLEYLRAKLKGAQLHEKLLKK